MSVDECFAGKDCAIVMYDLKCKLSLHDVLSNYYHVLGGVGPKTPVVFVGNNAELAEGDRGVKLKDIARFRGNQTCRNGEIKVRPDHKKKAYQLVPHVEISNKTGDGINEPFLVLARKMIGDDTLEFL